MKWPRRALSASVVYAMTVAACANDSPPSPVAPPIPQASETEVVAAAHAKGVAAPANAAAAQPLADDAEDAAPAGAPKPAAPEEYHLRYGPKVYALPAGCGPKGEKFSCNPLTNAGCRADDDEVCDEDDDEGFGCGPDSDNVKEGGDCDDQEGPSCAAGLTCNTPSEAAPGGICRKFCCTKNDCPSGTQCVVLDRAFGLLGACE